jgi:hypothetical protein
LKYVGIFGLPDLFKINFRQIEHYITIFVTFDRFLIMHRKNLMRLHSSTQPFDE